MPLFTEELRTVVVAAMQEIQKRAKENEPEYAKASVEELWKGLIRSAKAGDIDIAASLTGPDAAGTRTAIVAVSFDDTAALDKAVRKMVMDGPEEIRKLVKFDVAKVNNVSIHEAEFSGVVPPEGKAVFGDKAVLCVALAPKGIYAAYGPDALQMTHHRCVEREAAAGPRGRSVHQPRSHR